MCKVLFALTFMCFIVPASISIAVAQDQPNIVFIFADDLSDYDIGAYGNEEVRTLNIDARQFIEHASEYQDPFFMYLAFNAPHDPRQSPKEYVDSYNPEELQIPGNFLPEYPYNEATIYLQDVSPTAIELAGECTFEAGHPPADAAFNRIAR